MERWAAWRVGDDEGIEGLDQEDTGEGLIDVAVLAKQAGLWNGGEDVGAEGLEQEEAGEGAAPKAKDRAK